MEPVRRCAVAMPPPPISPTTGRYVACGSVVRTPAQCRSETTMSGLPRIDVGTRPRTSFLPAERTIQPTLVDRSSADVNTSGWRHVVEWRWSGCLEADAAQLFLNHELRALRDREFVRLCCFGWAGGFDRQTTCSKSSVKARQCSRRIAHVTAVATLKRPEPRPTPPHLVPPASHERQDRQIIPSASTRTPR